MARQPGKTRPTKRKIVTRKKAAGAARLSERDIARIADLVADRIFINLRPVSSPLNADCGGGFGCSTKYQCEGGFTCYSFLCRRDFTCEAGNNFVCPRDFSCSNVYKHPD